MSRLTLLSPLPPERSGISDYTRALAAALAERAEVTVLAGAEPQPIPGVRVAKAGRGELRRLSRQDAVIAHIGNNVDFHGWIVDTVRRRPALVVLHDVVLHHLVAGMTMGRGDGAAYLDALTAEGGKVGRLLGHAVVDGTLPPLWSIAPQLHPMTSQVLGQATGVVVHSRHAAAAVRLARPDLPVTVIPHLALDDGAAPPARLAGDPFPVIGFFGFVTREKRLPSIIRALSLARRELPRARLLVVGSAPDELDPRALARREGLPGDAVEVTGFADSVLLPRLVAGTDIGVSLRAPTLGETSGTVVRLLSAGVPTVVSPGGWYDELPDDAVARVEPDEDEARNLAATLVRLARDEAARGEMGDAARRYARERLAPDAVADAYLRASLAPAGATALSDAMLDELGSRVSDVSTPEAREAAGMGPALARAVRDIGVT